MLDFSESLSGLAFWRGSYGVLVLPTRLVACPPRVLIYEYPNTQIYEFWPSGWQVYEVRTIIDARVGQSRLNLDIRGSNKAWKMFKIWKLKKKSKPNWPTSSYKCNALHFSAHRAPFRSLTHTSWSFIFWETKKPFKDWLKIPPSMFRVLAPVKPIEKGCKSESGEVKSDGKQDENTVFYRFLDRKKKGCTFLTFPSSRFLESNDPHVFYASLQCETQTSNRL